MGGRPKAPAPPPPVPVMPLPDDEAIKQSKKKNQARQMARSGRMSTILSDASNDSLGA